MTKEDVQMQLKHAKKFVEEAENSLQKMLNIEEN